MQVRTVACLPAIVGAWGVPGGGALLSTSETFGLRLAALEKPEFLKRHPKIPRTINMVRLGEALLDIQDPPVKAMFVYNSNPAVVAPNQARVLAGLEREDLFTVVHEQVMTDTARYADIVLPAPTTFEDFDLHTAYGHLYLQLSKPAIPPMGEVKTNVQMFKALAKAMKLNDACFDDTEEDMIRQALSSNHPTIRGITYEQLDREQIVRLNLPRPFIPFADGKYSTPSGKIEFYSENMLRQGFDPVPNHNPTTESADGNPELFAKYPVRLVTPAAHHFLNSSFADMPTMIKKQLYPAIELHQVDADGRGIKHGEWVRAWNDRGEAYFVAEVKDTVAPGVACHVSLWWNKYSPKGFNCNVLTSDAGADMGQGGTFHTNLIQIEKASHKLSEPEISEFNAMFPAVSRVQKMP
jgi:anaerobic selenocysteine-containing dehydrogenase